MCWLGGACLMGGWAPGVMGTGVGRSSESLVGSSCWFSLILSLMVLSTFVNMLLLLSRAFLPASCVSCSTSVVMCVRYVCRMCVVSVEWVRRDEEGEE